MKCSGCGSDLVSSRPGAFLVRNRGLLLKAEGVLAVVCPKCKAEVAASPDLEKALRAFLISRKAS